MSAPAAWAPPPDLRDATLEAFRIWRLYHPGKRLPPSDSQEHSALLREYAHAFQTVPPTAIGVLADAMVRESPRAFWPNLGEVQSAVTKFQQRRAAAQQPATGKSAYDIEAHEAAERERAHCKAILCGLDLDGAHVDRDAQSRALERMMAELLKRLWRAKGEGSVTVAQIADFRAARWPTPEQLERRVRALAAECAP